MIKQLTISIFEIDFFNIYFYKKVISVIPKIGLFLCNNKIYKTFILSIYFNIYIYI